MTGNDQPYRRGGMSTDDLFGAGLTASRDVGGGAHSGGYTRGGNPLVGHAL